MIYDIWTVFWREWLVLHRRIGRFILSRMVSPVLYLVAFGWGLGRNIQVNQGSYLDFIVPGIIALNAMNISFISVGSPLNMSRLYHKTLEEYLIAPISSVAFVIGKVLAGAMRGLISSVLIIVLADAFGAHLIINSWFFLTLLLNCLVFASMALVAAMTMNSHEDMANFNTYVLLPMSFLCATFFVPDHLPVALHWIIQILPLTHASLALRAIVTGAAVPVFSLAIMLSYSIVFIGAGVWLMEKVRE